jgi:YggT family protein
VWNLVYFAAQAYLLCLLGRIVLSWFPPSGPGLLESIRRGLFAITEPVLGPVRRMIPPVRMGGMGLDLSPLIVFLVLQIIIAWVPH